MKYRFSACMATVGVALGCTSRAATPGDSSVPSVARQASSVPAQATTGATTSAGDRSPQIRPSEKKRQDSTKREASGIRRISVRELLSMPASATEEIVEVHGWCLAKGSERALGRPPVTRSDWQLADDVVDTVAVFVTGTPPSGCGFLGTENVRVSITATVARDTLAALVGQGSLTRVFLIRR